MTGERGDTDGERRAERRRAGRGSHRRERSTQFIRTRRELCRVLVRDTEFPFLRRYPQLVRTNPRTQQEGVAGYEMALNFIGMPIELIPRTESEIKSKSRIQLLSVNEAEKRVNPYSECHQTRQALCHVEPEKGAISLERLPPTLTEPLFKKSRRVSALRN